MQTIVRLIFYLCSCVTFFYLFGQPTDDIVLMAQSLEKIFLQKVAQMPEEEVELPPPAPRNKNSRGRGRKSSGKLGWKFRTGSWQQSSSESLVCLTFDPTYQFFYLLYNQMISVVGGGEQLGSLLQICWRE